MPVFEIDPLSDTRWAALVQSDGRSTVFHTTEWLEALRRTYGYPARVFTASPAGTPLVNGIVFAQVRSWLTGARLVSLPFSDHCEPLVGDTAELRTLLTKVKDVSAGRFKFAELRPRSPGMSLQPDFGISSQYSLHAMDLCPDIEELFSKFDKDSIQRKIRRAEREHLVLVQGRSESLLNQFYELMVLTRRRHYLPPQPLAWFRNLMECFGTRLTIYIALLKDQPIASILTLRHKKTVVYKYGCSNALLHNTGAMPFLFWHSIREAKSENLLEFDLGRSGLDQPGLIRFKNHLGAAGMPLTYWRSGSISDSTHAGGKGFGQKLLPHLPDEVLKLAGKILYRHFG